MKQSQSPIFSRHFSAILLCLLPLLPLRAENGDWRIYSAYHDAQQVVAMHGIVYVQSDGGLYSYDPEDTSIQTYDKTDVLSDVGIYSIVPCEATNTLAIIYQNGNIDIMDADGDVYNLPDLKQKPLSNKTLYEAHVVGTTLYVATASGVVCVDMQRQMFADFYAFSHPVQDVMLADQDIYVATNAEVMRGSLSDNLLDPTAWTLVRSVAWIRRMHTWKGSIMVMQTSNVVRVTNPEKFYVTATISGQRFQSWKEVGEHLYLFLTTGGVYELLDSETYRFVEGSEGIYDLSYSKGKYWAACGQEGLKAYTLSSDGTSLTPDMSSVLPDSPRRNRFYRLNMLPGGRLLVAGGAFLYPEVFYPGTLMQYDGGWWTNFDEEGPIERVGTGGYVNATDLVQDPHDPTHHWGSAMSSGLYEFRDYKLVAHYNHTNSPLQTIVPDSKYPERYVRVSALAFDSDDNLWMCNNDRDTIFRMLRPDGTWMKYHVPEVETFTVFDRIIFDRQGYAWANQRLSGPHSDGGILVIDTHGNPSRPSGFTHRFFDQFLNQDSKSYSPTSFYCVTEDLDGVIWIGNDAGIFRVDDISDIFATNVRLTQIKVPRNDGSNLADYLLSDVPVKCITIDGGNRKWIGTRGNGVYLLSADGLEQLEHFTADNSPLLGNGIYDIAIDGQTGIVYIATDEGLCSFHGDATDPAPSLSESNVRVYPNPVRPDYGGKIIITGLAYNTNVKIVNAGGRLVNEGTSVGGEYTWDGTLTGGGRCSSGIYYVLATDADGKKGVATKFLIIRD